MDTLYSDLKLYLDYAKQTLDPNISCSIFAEKLRELELLSPMFKEKCRYLTQRRVDSHSEDRLRDVKKLRTDGSARLYTSVKEFWKFVSGQLDIIAASYVDDMFNTLGLDKEDTSELQQEKYIKLHRSMKDNITKLRDLLVAIAAVSEYAFLNYPKLMRNICKRESAMDYTFYTLINQIKERLGDDLKEVLECSFEIMTQEIMDSRLLQLEPQYSMFSMLSCYGLEVSEGYSTSQFLEDHINSDIQRLKTGEVDDTFLKIIYVGVRKELILRKLCNVESRNSNKYLQLFLDESIFLKILNYMLKKYENRLEIADENLELRKDDAHYMLRKFYNNNGSSDNYYSYITKFIHRKLKTAKESKSSLENIFIQATNLAMLFYFDRKVLKLIMEELCECFSGSLQMYESFEKLLEMKIRKYNRNHEKAIEAGSEYKIREDLAKNKFHDRCLFILPSALKFESSFLKLHQQKLFRRAIMQGPEIYETISDFSYLEMNVLYALISLYEKTDEMHALYDLYLSLRKSYLFLQDYKKENNQHVVPLIIDKRNVPTVFQKEANEALILPQELQQQWEDIHRFFKENTASSDAKTLVPVYSLQHCDVETPFLLENRKKLVLNLSIYQTCVLDLFNEDEIVTVEMACTRTGLKPDTIMQVIQSFESARLVVSTGAGFCINNEFQPDPKRVKDGKLRIPMVAQRAPSSSDTTTSGASTRPHSEGYSSLWRQELIKAAIARNLKAAPELSQDELFSTLSTQGASVGEFKDAVAKLVSDKVIQRTKTGYKY